MMIWGHKTDSFLDVWSIEHLVMGISLGSLYFLAQRLGLSKLMLPETSNRIILILLISFIWETIEHYLETGMAGAGVETWFAGVEHWSNRLISDHLMVIIGVMIYSYFPLLLWPARIFSVLWLFVHIFIFQDSMYLHNL